MYKRQIVGWEWVTGGNFSMMLASVLILASWMAYRQAIYPVFIGLIFLPVTFYLFPDTFVSFALLMTGLLVGILIWWILTRQPSGNA